LDSFGQENRQLAASESPSENEKLASEIWLKFLDLFSLNISELKMNTWFKPLKPISLNENTLTVSVPSADYCDMIVSRFGEVVKKAAQSLLGDSGKLEYKVDGSLSYYEQEPVPAYPQKLHVPFIQAPVDTVIPSRTDRCYLNPDYTFDNFVKGKSNEFAVAAAFSISNRPGSQYNPLMLYGGVGLGKTHLMQAIGNFIQQLSPSMKIMYTSGPDFTTNFVQSIKTNRAPEFERLYKSLDMLIVDDIQFLEGKESTQDSFFQIFNSLYQLKKQIVLSSDKPPHQLEGLEERLITRFQWGLTVDILPPDLETRIAILNKKCEKEGITTDYEILEFIAVNIKDNIRSLEGCLKSIIFDSELTQSPITIDLAKRNVLKFGGIKNRKQNIDIGTIITTVSKFFNIDESLLRLKSKQQEIVEARHAAMYLSKELTSSSLQTIGAHFGGRNHATVIHAYKCIEDSINNNSSFKDKMEQIKDILLTM
jgi:chromosomal replication initiator protein